MKINFKPIGKETAQTVETAAPVSFSPASKEVSAHKSVTFHRLSEAKYEFGSTQVDLPPMIAKQFQLFAKAVIDPKDLVDDGSKTIETDPHVTVKYGLHDPNPAKVKSVLQGEGAVKIKLGKLKVFPADAKRRSDVLVVSIDSPDMHRLNKKVSDALPNTTTYPTYTPHATVAYLKPGRGKKYLGNDHLMGTSAVINTVQVSNRHGVKRPVRLGEDVTVEGKVIDKSKEFYTKSVGNLWRELERDDAERVKVNKSGNVLSSGRFEKSREDYVKNLSFDNTAHVNAKNSNVAIKAANTRRAKKAGGPVLATPLNPVPPKPARPNGKVFKFKKLGEADGDLMSKIKADLASRKDTTIPDSGHHIITHQSGPVRLDAQFNPASGDYFILGMKSEGEHHGLHVAKALRSLHRDILSNPDIKTVSGHATEGHLGRMFRRYGAEAAFSSPDPNVRNGETGLFTVDADKVRQHVAGYNQRHEQFVERMSKRILEALNPSQKKVVDSWDQPHDSHAFSDHVFGGPKSTHHRTTIELQASPDHQPQAHPALQQHLQSHGYEIHDYAKGLAKKKDDPRPFRIGSVLARTKAPADVMKHYVNAADRAQTSDHHIVISRHPHDVAAMSSGQGWKSCMTMGRLGGGGGGAYNDALKHDVKEGTHVAYLTHKDDKDLKNPTARIALKPYHAKRPDGTVHTVIRPEPKVYGTTTGDFRKSVKDWAEKHFPLEKGLVYRKNGRVYDDGGAREIFHGEDHPHLQHEDPTYRAEAVTHPTNTPEALHRAASDPHPLVRASVASHPRTQDHTHQLLARDASPMVVKAVAEHAKSPELIDRLYSQHGHDADTAERVAKNVHTSGATLTRIASDHKPNPTSGINGPDPVGMVAYHPNTPPETLHSLAGKYSNPSSPGGFHQRVTYGVAAHANAHPDTLHAMASVNHDHYSSVHAVVARNPNTRADTLEKLAGHDDPYVVKHVARHENTPTHVIRHLTSHVDDEVSGAARNTLTLRGKKNESVDESKKSKATEQGSLSFNWHDRITQRAPAPSSGQYGTYVKPVKPVKFKKIAEGKNGDWKGEGYVIRHKVVPIKSFMDDSHVGGQAFITAHDKEGNEVGSLNCSTKHKEDYISVHMTKVAKPHQRKGLASAMYDRARELFPNKPFSTRAQSPQAKKFRKAYDGNKKLYHEGINEGRYSFSRRRKLHARHNMMTWSKMLKHVKQLRNYVSQKYEGVNEVKVGNASITFGERNKLRFKKLHQDPTEIKHGQPVTLAYNRRTFPPAPKMGARFGQDVEPHGEYMSHGHDTQARDNTVNGTVRFKKPYVVSGDPEGNYTWKQRLSAEHGKKGKALSTHLKKKGYDGIIAMDSENKHPLEIVNLQGRKVIHEGNIKYASKKFKFIGDDKGAKRNGSIIGGCG